MRRIIAAFRANQSGATAVEYALLLALLGLIVAASITSLGSSLYNNKFNVINNAIK